MAQFDYIPYTHDGSKTTLWMGDLEPWMDETYIRQLWLSLGENVIVKLIRDKRTGISAGYAFIGFSSSLAAQRALATVHGTKIPNTHRVFRLNWASGGGIHDRKEDRAPEYSLFVGDLSSEVDETLLLALFRRRYPSCHSAKVMTDPVSGLSRGYGFVRFHDPTEHQDALTQMNGVYCGNRPMRVSLATPKNSNARYHQLALQAPALVQQPTDPSNTTVFVGGLSSPVTEDELRSCFAPFGEIVYVKIPPNKGCGFVQYVSRQSAELAIEQMNGYQIGSSRIRLSWGRSQNEKSSSAVTWQPQQQLPVLPGTVMPQTRPLTSSFLQASSLLRHRTGPMSLLPDASFPMGQNVIATSPDTFGSISPPLLVRHHKSPNILSDYAIKPAVSAATTEQQNAWLWLDRDRDTTNWRLNGIYAQ